MHRKMDVRGLFMSWGNMFMKHNRKKYVKNQKKSKKMLKKVLTNEKTCDSLTKVAAREQKTKRLGRIRKEET